mmetsp:Transcript_67500/g.133180  ORF Transcript_67500/g.133180 Transcript_67500/m.133180 type:complete len:307 (+) Transcript_67500:3-923(+)
MHTGAALHAVTFGDLPRYIAADSRCKKKTAKNRDCKWGEWGNNVHAAAAHGHVELLTHMVGNDTYKWTQNREGNTPLALAAHNGHLSVVKHLVHLANNKEPLICTARNAATGGTIAVPVLKYLVQQGVDVRRSCSGVSPLNEAIADAGVGMVQALVEAGEHLHEEHIAEAADAGNLRIAKYLLEAIPRGKDPSYLNNALRLAGKYGDVNMLESLLAARADATATMRQGSALHEVVKSGVLPAVKLLLSSRADPSVRNRQGNKPIDVAKKMSQEANTGKIHKQLLERVVEFLEANGMKAEGTKQSEL